MRISDMVYIDALNRSLSSNDFIETSIQTGNGIWQTAKVKVNDIANCVKGHNILTGKIDSVLSTIPTEGEIGDIYAKINNNNFYDFYIITKKED